MIDGHTVIFSGADIIDGGSGNDDIYGLGGDDDITPGAGSDKIHFDASGGNDIVHNFAVGEDTIYMHMTSKSDVSELTIYDQNDDLIIQLDISKSITPIGHAGTTLDNNSFVFTETTIAY